MGNDLILTTTFWQVEDVANGQHMVEEKFKRMKLNLPPYPEPTAQLAEVDVIMMALCGNFAEIDSLRPPKLKLHLFISCAQVDTFWERDTILNDIFSIVRAKGRDLGIDVVFSADSYEREVVALDRTSWADIYHEIKECKQSSFGLYFVSLQTDK